MIPQGFASLRPRAVYGEAKRGKAATSMDRLFLREIEVACVIGVHEWERKIEQIVRIDVDLETDLRRACMGDDIRETVDYKQVRDRIVSTVKEARCFLIEALAERVAEACLSEPRVRAVRVRLEKPGALRMARTVGVDIFRTRSGRTDESLGR